MKKILFFKLITILLVCVSCKKYLDKKSNPSLTTPDKLSDLQAILDDESHFNQYSTPAFGEASSDNYFLLQSVYDSRISIIQEAYKWLPVKYEFPNDWSTAYYPINASNLCLERLRLISVNNQNKSSWQNIMGSSLFFRAYYFLQLVSVYSKAFDNTSADSDLGIVLRLTSDVNIPSIRASVLQTYNQIVNDAKSSVEYLPVNPSTVFRPSKPAAYALLARTYLSMRMYDSAFKYASLSLSLKSTLLDYNSVSQTYGYDTPFEQYSFSTNGEIILCTDMLSAFSSTMIYGSPIDTTLYNVYEDNDLRKTLYFVLDDGYNRFKGSYVANSYFSGLATDEIILIKAECYARGINGGQPDKVAALNELNLLLKNRYDLTFTPIDYPTSQEVLDRVLLERRKELLMRGLRWTDIKRLNKEGRGITLQRSINGNSYRLLPNDPRYALPLPDDVVRIAGIIQN